MRASLALRASLLCVCAELTACGGPQLARIGPPLALPQGEAQNACEQRNWIELAPTRVETTTTRGGGYVYHHYSQVHEGVGVYRFKEDEPEELEDLYPAMREPALERAHQGRIEPVDAANREALYWLLGGIVGMGVGIGTAAAIQDQSGTAAAVAGISGLVIGIGGLIGGLVAMPSADEELAADARRKIFILEEDDLYAVVRGVDRANARERLQCGGRPVPFALANAEKAPPPTPTAAPPPAEIAPIHLDEDQSPQTDAPPADTAPSQQSPTPDVDKPGL